MAELETKQLVVAFLTILVIIVAIIMFLTLDAETKAQIFGIFENAFYGKKTTVEEAEQNTVDAQQAFLEGIDKCNFDEKINPNSAENCFCFTEDFGVISDKAYLSIQNQGGESTVTAIDVNGVSLAQEKSYALGLLVTKDGTKDSNGDISVEIGCIFPSQFFIQGEDVDTIIWGKNIINTWNIIWKDERVKKSWYETGEYKEWKFYYKDKESQYKSTIPALYKLSDTQYCLVTDLIENPLEIQSLDGYQTSPPQQQGTMTSAPGVSPVPLLLSSNSASSVKRQEILDYLIASIIDCNKL